MKLVNCLHGLLRRCSSSFVFHHQTRRLRQGYPPVAVELLENRSLLAAPVAVDDAAATDEDTPTTFGVLGNDSDPDGDPITVVSVTDGLLGTAVVNGDSTITYTPSADFIRLGQSFTDTISYTIDDGPGMGGMATAQVTITVGGMNDAPFVQLRFIGNLGG